MKYTVVGSINTDLVMHTKRIPKVGETVLGNGFSINCGGKGANQAVALAKLGGDVTFIGAVGNDANGSAAIENLKKYQIHTESVTRTETNTGVAIITVYNGDNSIILDSGANALVTKEMVESYKEMIQQADVLILQLEIPLETVVYAAKTAHEAGVLVVLNPAPVRSLPEELIQNTDILILNETETEFLTGIVPDSEENQKKCLQILKELGFPKVIITLGADGSVCESDCGFFHQRAYNIPVVDTTAAGDTFIGAFLLHMKDSMETAIQYATAAAALAVSRNGAGNSVPTKEEVQQFLKKYEEIK